MTATAALFELAVVALTNATSAGANVFSALDFPTWNGSYPCLYIHPPEEEKQGLGRAGAPQFTVTATLTVEARYQAELAATSSPFDTAAATVEAALFQLGREIEVALINYPDLMALLSQFPFIRTRQTLTAEGEQHLGNLTVQVGMEFYQGPEDFYPTPVTPVGSANFIDPVTGINPSPTTTGFDMTIPVGATNVIRSHT